MGDSVNYEDIKEIVVLDEREVAVDLFTAAVDGCLENLREILDTFPHLVHAYASQTGNTALHLAAQENHLKLVEVLIDDYKADVNAKAKEGITPIFYAARSGNVAMIDSLVSRKADLTVKFRGDSLLHVAAAARKRHAVARLLSAGVKMDARGRQDARRRRGGPPRRQRYGRAPERGVEERSRKL